MKKKISIIIMIIMVISTLYTKRSLAQFTANHYALSYSVDGPTSLNNNNKIKKMEQLTLSIKFTAKPENREQFKKALTELFTVITKEKNFVSATLHEDLESKGEFLVYETWNDNIQHFIGVQMKQPYAIKWEKLLVEMEIKRDPAAFMPFATFRNTAQ